MVSKDSNMIRKISICRCLQSSKEIDDKALSYNAIIWITTIVKCTKNKLFETFLLCFKCYCLKLPIIGILKKRYGAKYVICNKYVYDISLKLIARSKYSRYLTENFQLR